ncbi:MAG: SUMF1/EgtB/PvdO family nonheme iron enzyme [Myxococcota bacterium]
MQRTWTRLQPLFLMVVALIGLLAPAARVRAETLPAARHAGAVDPLSEGFDDGNTPPPPAGIVLGPVSSGTPAEDGWAVVDSGSSKFQYSFRPEPGNAAAWDAAWQAGYTLRARVLTPDPGDGVDVGVLVQVGSGVGGGRRHIVGFGVSAGRQTANLHGGTLGCDGNATYRTYELVFDGSTATLGTPGETGCDAAITGIAPATLAFSPLVDFGSGISSGTGTGHFALVELTFTDADGDGLDHYTELVRGTDPNLADSDVDGLSDGEELNLHGTDPLDPDTDDDGLPDGAEVDTYATDPAAADTDEDGFDDGTEVDLGTDPLAGTDSPIAEKLLAADADADARFGSNVAVSGDTAIVLAPGDDESTLGIGAAYVFVHDGARWTQQQKLLPSEGSFGESVAISGDTAVIGSAFANGNTGAAYVFSRDGGIWTEQQRLVDLDGVSGDSFGWSVAISGDTVVVGSPFAVGLPVSPFQTGAAFVFTRSGGLWTEQARLVAPLGFSNQPGHDTEFGFAVSVSGDTALIGAPRRFTGKFWNGAAYVFVRNAGIWTGQATFFPFDSTVWLGQSVSVSGDTAVVGAFHDPPSAIDYAGSVYVFTRSGTTWTQQQELEAIDDPTPNFFGLNVSVDGDTVVVGAPLATPAGFQSGSAYVFTRKSGVWSGQPRLVAADAAIREVFGASVAVSGDRVLVGASGADAGFVDAGAVYAFDLDGDDDGLSNLDEMAAGTDVLDPDSDDDGLSDGAEVNLYATDPILADSDADGVDDGAEVVAGTDPLDAGRYPLAPALVFVADPGNAADTTGFGAVAQPFEIAAFEVSNRDWVAFLNAVADDDPNGLFNETADQRYGIVRTGSPGSHQYFAVVGREDRPVNFVSVYDAMRFVNWLVNGQPEGAQGPATTEDGAYAIDAGGIGANDIARHPGAAFALPSEEEWYKAAHYDPTAPGSYRAQPAGSSVVATCAAPSGLPDAANCGDAVADTTDVGSYAGAAGPSGTFDQGGNVWEWTESIAGANRRIRGGSFASPSATLAAASSGLDQDPLVEAADLGFRVVPESSGFGALGTGSAVIAAAGGARRRRSIRRGTSSGR